MHKVFKAESKKFMQPSEIIVLHSFFFANSNSAALRFGDANRILCAVKALRKKVRKFGQLALHNESYLLKAGSATVL